MEHNKSVGNTAKKPVHSKENLLRNSDIFSSLLPHELEVVAGSSYFHNYESEQQIFSPGDSGDALYLVETGEVVVQKLDESRQKIDIARLIKGNCFGELDLFSEKKRDAFASASTETRLLIFPKPGVGFETFLAEHPKLSARILHKLLVNIAERIRSANSLIKDNSPLIQELKRQVYRDKLTGIYNQAHILEKVREYMKKKESGFSLLISKPDNFKVLNDSYGHDMGDKAIRIMARGLRDFIGDDERVARYKGNAMSVILPGIQRAEAFLLAQSILGFINELDISEATGGESFRITASIGLTTFPEHGKNAEELLSLTHELPLAGRNRGGNLILFPEDLEEA